MKRWEPKTNKKINIKQETLYLMPALGITATMLFMPIFFKLPYGYYTLLRMVIFLASGFFTLAAYKLRRHYWMITLGLIMILFNPIIKIHFAKEIWRGIDFLVGVIFLVFIFNLLKKNV